MAYCDWRQTSAKNMHYHDEEWGVPLHDDRAQFEFLMLEIMQCGLSWNIIINKREILQNCFDNFDYDKIAHYSTDDIARIMNVDGMIKSPRKIAAVINNAQCFIKIRREFGSFSAYLWNFSQGKTIIYDRHEKGYIPASNRLSDDISQDLKKRGFKFVGTVTVYSHLQACGVINDHDQNCPRFGFINSHFPITRKKREAEKQVHYFG